MRGRAALIAVIVLSAAAGAVSQTSGADAATPTVYFYLPWEPNQNAYVSQGQYGSVSHFGSYAYAFDFVLSSASKEVRASAPGTIYLKTTNVSGQVSSPTDPKAWGNYVVVKHPDGTCTRYAHLKSGSVTSLSTGSRIYQGQALGVQGNTGYTLPAGGGYHLHFERENCTTGSPTSIDVDFVEVANPLEGGTYTSADPAGLKCSGEYATQVGTSGDQTIYGTEGSDFITAREGDDTVFGGGGNDSVCGGSGSDKVYGGTGNDFLFGESGNDYLYGESGLDFLSGSTGTDNCDGGSGVDAWSSCEVKKSLP